jgi:hypothetical protein
MLNMFDPKTFPIDRGAPPDNAAVMATVSSGRVVAKEINVKPIEVLPNLLIAATLVAYLITLSLAIFRNRSETTITIRF